MPEDRGFCTLRDITDHVFRVGGPPVTPHQLKKWRRWGLIGPATQVSQKGKRGREARYPTGTQFLAVALRDAARADRDLEQLVWVALEFGRPLSQMRPALRDLLRRRESTLQQLRRVWRMRGGAAPSQRARQVRVAGQRIPPKYRSLVAYVVATLLASATDAPKARAATVEALWESLLDSYHPAPAVRDALPDALDRLAAEVSLARVDAHLAEATSDVALDRLIGLLPTWRAHALSTGAMHVGASWLPLFWLLLIAYEVSPSLSDALRNLDPSTGSPVELLASAIKSACIHHYFRVVPSRKPLPGHAMDQARKPLPGEVANDES